jgi:hypothetical protein
MSKRHVSQSPLRFSDWANPKNRMLNVTREELLLILMQFKDQLDADRLHRRALRWLKHGWLPNKGLRVDAGRPGTEQPAKPELHA